MERNFNLANVYVLLLDLWEDVSRKATAVWALELREYDHDDGRRSASFPPQVIYHHRSGGQRHRRSRTNTRRRSYCGRGRARLGEGLIHDHPARCNNSSRRYYLY